MGRSARRRERRLNGWAGSKNIIKNGRKRDGFQRQLDACEYFFGKWAYRKPLDYIKNNIDKFFENYAEHFDRDVAQELRYRLGVHIKNQEEKNKEAEANPITQPTTPKE